MRPTRSGQPHLGQPHVLYMCVPGTGAQDVLQQPGAAAVREQHSVVALTAIRPAIASSARVGCSTVGCSTKFCSSAGPPQSVATVHSVRHSRGNCVHTFESAKPGTHNCSTRPALECASWVAQCSCDASLTAACTAAVMARVLRQRPMCRLHSASRKLVAWCARL